jgi:hypothetical protein
MNARLASTAKMVTLTHWLLETNQLIKGSGKTRANSKRSKAFYKDLEKEALNNIVQPNEVLLLNSCTITFF